MATTAVSAAVLLLLLSLVAAASARPCKTLFYFSATTTTTGAAFFPFFSSLPRNPNLHLLVPGHGPRHLTLIFSSDLSLTSDLNPELDDASRLSLIQRPSDVPLKLQSSISSSIRDRSRDIMSVVGALLFGVGCGGLTAAIMYFLWALFSPGRFHFEDFSSSSDYDEDDYDAADAKKKMGYVMIPAQPAVVDDDLKKPASAVIV